MKTLKGLYGMLIENFTMWHTLVPEGRDAAAGVRAPNYSSSQKQGRNHAHEGLHGGGVKITKGRNRSPQGSWTIQCYKHIQRLPPSRRRHGNEVEEGLMTDL